MCTLPALIAAALTACGSGGGAPATTDAAAGSTTVAAADAGATNAALGASDATTLRTTSAPNAPGAAVSAAASAGKAGGSGSTDTTSTTSTGTTSTGTTSTGTTSTGTTSTGTTSTGTTSTGTTSTGSTAPAAKRNSLDLIISDVTQPSSVHWAYPGYGKADGSPWRWESLVYATSMSSVQLLDQLAQSNGFASNFYDRVNAVIPGVHTAEGQGNRATNTQVLKRNLTSYVLYRSTGKWVRVSGPSRPVGQIDRWATWGLRYGAQDELPADSLARQRKYDEYTTAVRPQAPYESEAYDFGFPANIKDVAAFFVTFEAKLELINPNGVDDRDQAVYVTNAWMDFGDTVGQANGMPRYLAGNAPGHALDVGLGRIKQITKDWQPFNLVSMKTYDNSMLASPFGFPEWTKINPAGQPPYALTEAQLRANPPPIEF